MPESPCSQKHLYETRSLSPKEAPDLSAPYFIDSEDRRRNNMSLLLDGLTDSKWHLFKTTLVACKIRVPPYIHGVLALMKRHVTGWTPSL